MNILIFTIHISKIYKMFKYVLIKIYKCVVYFQSINFFVADIIILIVSTGRKWRPFKVSKERVTQKCGLAGQWDLRLGRRPCDLAKQARGHSQRGSGDNQPSGGAPVTWLTHEIHLCGRHGRCSCCLQSYPWTKRSLQPCPNTLRVQVDCQVFGCSFQEVSHQQKNSAQHSKYRESHFVF